MTEVTRENKVLLEEVDRLRQMYAVSKQQLAVKDEACTKQVASLREELQRLKHVHKGCVCCASQHDAWSRDGWGYDDQSTAKQLLNRSRYAYDAIFNALRFCVESSAGANLGSSNANSRMHPVDAQIRSLMEFLSQQGVR